MSAKLPIPEQIVVHGFLFNRGEKMSKSVGNIIDPADLVERYGVDQIRYFFLREVPFGQDGNYSHEAIVARVNADLANDLGNLAQRSLSMIARNCEGRAPAAGNLNGEDAQMLAQADSMAGAARAHMAAYAIHSYLGAVFDVVASANRYFAASEPWKLAKTDHSRMKSVLSTTIEVLRNVAILLQPVMPGAMGRLLDCLAVAPEARSFAALGASGRLAPGTPLPAPAPLFPRYVEPEAAQ
jgi:methionyl-tRNA synthetase